MISQKTGNKILNDNQLDNLRKNICSAVFYIHVMIRQQHVVPKNNCRDLDEFCVINSKYCSKNKFND